MVSSVISSDMPLLSPNTALRVQISLPRKSLQAVNGYQLDQLLGSDVSLGLLTDVIGYMLEIDLAEKQALLAEVNVQRRAEMLLAHLSSAAAERPGKGAHGLFPPQFSTN
jgi:hypothetical protein